LAVRQPLERGRHHRDGLRPPRPREVGRRFDPKQRSAGRSGCHPGARNYLYRDEPAGRSVICGGRSPHSIRLRVGWTERRGGKSTMARTVLNTHSASESTNDLGSVRVRSLWTDALHRLLQNRGAAVGGVIFLLIIIVAIIAPLIAPYNPIKLNVVDSLQSPSGRHWLGTDQFGRDTLSRIIYGSRISVAMGLVAVAISVVGGSVLGLVSGYFRGLTDMLVSRLVDVMLGFPGILLALVVIAVHGTNLSSAMIAVGVSGMPIFIRVVRGSTLSA